MMDDEDQYYQLELPIQAVRISTQDLSKLVRNGLAEIL